MNEYVVPYKKYIKVKHLPDNWWSITFDAYDLREKKASTLTFNLHPYEWGKFELRVKDAVRDGSSERIFTSINNETVKVTFGYKDNNILFTFENLKDDSKVYYPVMLTEEEMAILFWRCSFI